MVAVTACDVVRSTTSSSVRISQCQKTSGISRWYMDDPLDGAMCGLVMPVLAAYHTDRVANVGQRGEQIKVPVTHF